MPSEHATTKAYQATKGIKPELPQEVSYMSDVTPSPREKFKAGEKIVCVDRTPIDLTVPSPSIVIGKEYEAKGDSSDDYFDKQFRVPIDDDTGCRVCLLVSRFTRPASVAGEGGDAKDIRIATLEAQLVEANADIERRKNWDKPLDQWKPETQPTIDDMRKKLEEYAATPDHMTKRADERVSFMSKIGAILDCQLRERRDEARAQLAAANSSITDSVLQYALACKRADELKEVLREAQSRIMHMLTELPSEPVKVGQVCTCTDGCNTPCKGECGCEECEDSYQDYLSSREE